MGNGKVEYKHELPQVLKSRHYFVYTANFTANLQQRKNNIYVQFKIEKKLFDCWKIVFDRLKQIYFTYMKNNNNNNSYLRHE